jgi:hypothetical protein
VLRRQGRDAAAVHARGRPGGGQARGGPVDVRLGVVLPAPGDEVLDGQQHEALGSGQPGGVGQAGHRPVVVHELGDAADRLQAGEPAQVDGGLGVPGAVQHPTGHGAQREHVAGPDEVPGTG